MKLHSILFSVAPSIHSDTVGWSCCALQFNHQPCSLMPPNYFCSWSSERQKQTAKLLPRKNDFPTLIFISKFWSRVDEWTERKSFPMAHCWQKVCESAPFQIETSLVELVFCFCLFCSMIQV